MQFPDYQVPFAGNGMVIGTNAVIHVVLSHGVAIGVFAMIVLTDWLVCSGSTLLQKSWDGYNRRLLKVLVITVTTVSALTGVGIWFTTTALAPRGIASMLRAFFWPWFIEWFVFVLEVVGLFIYYLLWDRLGGERRRRRVQLGAAYVALEQTDAGDEQIRQRSEAVLAANAALERRVMDHLLRVRDHLNLEQRRKLFGLCAEGLRQGQGWRWRNGQQGDAGGGAGPVGAGRGKGPAWRGGRGGGQ